MAAEIRLFPCLTDNFGYLIHDPETKATASIDAPEAAPILKALEREGWTLTDILITHHHHDHVGGVAELKQKYGCRVVAPHDKSTGIANADLRVGQGDILVTRVAGPALSQILPRVAGVVAELGGSTSHLASLARERGIPMVLGVLNATRKIPDGVQCAVDGVAGIVRWQR